MTEIIAWLKTRAHGFNLLSDKEISAISEFALLWSLFEARILNTEGSARAICDAVDAWRQAGTLDAAMLDPELAYFTATVLCQRRSDRPLRPSRPAE